MLVLKTLKVVEHVTQLHAAGEITVPEGHVFVAEHAAAQMLWKLGESYMAYGAPGTGKSFSACKMLADDAKPESITSCANTWVQVSGLKSPAAVTRSSARKPRARRRHAGC